MFSKSALLFFLSFLALLSFPASCCAVLPLPPPSPANIRYHTLELTDQSRFDPFAPDPETPRRLMLSVFQPTTCPPKSLEQLAYIPPVSATVFDEEVASFGVPPGTFSSFRLQICPSSHGPSNAPIALFSPGLGASRLLYSAILQWVSSTGFAIISIDHPHDADIVEYPDGSFVFRTVTDDELPQALEERVGDVLFVLDQISSDPQQFSLPSSSRVDKVPIFGHSFGGDTAVHVLSDSRIAGALNFDGSIFPAVTDVSDGKPFLLFAATGHNQSVTPDWAVFWQAHSGWKLQLEVVNTTHVSFTDDPILAKTGGLDVNKIPQLAEVLGTIDGLRMLEILQTYVGAFLDFAMTRRKEEILEKPSKKYPDVLFRNQTFT